MVKRYAKKLVKNYPAIRKRYKVYYPAIKQLGADVMYLKGLINSEPKSHQLVHNNNVGYNGVILSCSTIPQGDGSANRDGDRILPRYFTVHGRLQGAAAAVHLGVKCMIFRWWGESPNALGTLPSVSDVVEPSLVGTQNAPDSFLPTTVTGSKGDRNRRIEVLKTFYMVLDTSSGKSSYTINENIELNAGNKKEHMEYFDNTNYPPTSGGIFILIITDSATSGDLAYHFNTKLTFYDN